MRNYCLTKDELGLIIDYFLENKEIDKEQISLIKYLDNAIIWQDRLIGFNYFLTQLLGKELKNKKICDSIIESVYNFQNEFWFHNEEFGVDFINLIFTYLRDVKLDLHDNLIDLHYKYLEHEYGKNLCN